ncbi:MAG TPA: isochorismatase family cysteine hydrolase [Chitinophagaceae bacterium]|nr:isochorismatase family cysteine hydrolase [Chitinophagaceae bacterium]
MATISTSLSGQPVTKKALLILDIQDDFTGDNARMPMDAVQVKQMIDNLNSLITKLDPSSYEIVYIGNEFSKHDFLNVFRHFAAIKGTAGTKQDHRLKIISENYFPKNKENAFSNPELNAFLKSKSVTELYLGGLKAEACVFSTAKGAVRKGYKVHILTDCIATTTNKKRIKTLPKYVKAGAYNVTSETIK